MPTNNDIVNTQQREEIITLATEAITHGLAIAENKYSEQRYPENFTSIVMGILVRIIFDKLVNELGNPPTMARSTLIVLLTDLVFEACDEVREKRNG